MFRPIRGGIALIAEAIFLLTADLIQRVVLAPIIRLKPSSRELVLSWWARTCASITLGLSRHIGGARIENPSRIPAEAGVLVLMNHQSFFDIPILFQVLNDYPRMITRRRYARGIPLISHMLRLYKHPLVDPGRPAAAQFDILREVATNSTRPIALFPEGTRTRDGSIRRFQTAGLKTILGERDWQVYLIVADGLWRCVVGSDFVRKVSTVDAKVETVGPFAYSRASDDREAFISKMRDEMCAKLDAMRAKGAPQACS